MRPLQERFRAAALSYATRGWHVLPLRVGGKEPATEHGIYDATDDPATIESRWRTRPYNVGIRTGTISGLYVVDIDPGAVAPDGLTPTVETGRGWQAWFETDLDLPCTAGRLGPHIDTRGTGGYVVAPPSIHPNGKQYRWVHQGEPPDGGPPIFTSPPDWLIERLQTPTNSERALASARLIASQPRTGGNRYGEAALSGEIRTLVAAPKGQRNDALNRVGFRLFQLVAAGELAIERVKAALLDACQSNGLVADDGMRSVMRTIASSMAGLQHPRGRAAR